MATNPPPTNSVKINPSTGNPYANLGNPNWTPSNQQTQVAIISKGVRSPSQSFVSLVPADIRAASETKYAADKVQQQQTTTAAQTTKTTLSQAQVTKAKDAFYGTTTSTANISGATAAKLARESPRPQSIREDVDYTISQSTPKEQKKAYKRATSLSSPDRLKESEINESKNISSSSTSSDSSLLSGWTKVPNKKTQESDEAFRKRVEALSEREEKFYSSPGIKRISQMGSVLTFGEGKPIEERSFVGQVAETTTTGLLGWPIYLGGALPATGEKIMAIGEGTIKNPKDTFKELGFSFKKIESTAFSFLPGGTPINPEGASTVLTAGIFTAVGAPGIRDSSIGLKTRDVTIGEKGFKTIGFETKGGKGQPIINIEKSRISFGTPDVSESLINLKPMGKSAEGIRPGSPIETKILQKGLKNVPEDLLVNPERAQTLIPTEQSIIRSTQNVKSPFIDEFAKGTKALDAEGVGIVLEVAKQEGGLVSGSFSRSAQLAKEYKIGSKTYSLSKVPGDIDIHLTNTPEQIGIIAKNTLSRLQSRGYDAILKGEGGVVQNAILVKPKGGTEYIKAVEFLGEGTIPIAEVPPDMVIGFPKEGKPINIQGVKTTSLAEELRGTIQGVTRIRKTSSGKLDIFPREGRTKDIGSVSISARSLAEGKFFKSSLNKNIAKFESLFPEDLVRSQLELIPDKVVIADFSTSSKSPSTQKPSAITIKPLNIKSSPISTSKTSTYTSTSKTFVSTIASVPKSFASVSISSIPSSSSYIKPSPSLYKSPSTSPSRGRSYSPSSSNVPSYIPSITPSTNLVLSPSSSNVPSKTILPSPSQKSSPINPSVSTYTDIVGKYQPSTTRIRRLKTPSLSNEKNVFSVDVRRGGVFKTIGKGLTRSGAERLGYARVKGTAAATFRIKKGETIIPVKAKPGYYLKGGAVIETPKLRINTPGELSEITFKGIRASRRSLL